MTHEDLTTLRTDAHRLSQLSDCSTAADASQLARILRDLIDHAISQVPPTPAPKK